ncbi:hypothetical protein Leryth_023168 [Lithospermum erythrorhizon]|nr:hypothetical protein Leryth_023168 [Lithospermum erythrorhizon]
MNAPLDIGTRGTIGSLLKKEIEYFTSRREINMNHHYQVGNESSIKSQKRGNSEMASDEGSSWRNFSSFMMKWRRKKRRNSGVLPAMCSMVEISHSHRMNEMPGYSYRSLRDEFQNSDF